MDIGLHLLNKAQAWYPPRTNISDKIGIADDRASKHGRLHPALRQERFNLGLEGVGCKHRQPTYRTIPIGARGKCLFPSK